MSTYKEIRGLKVRDYTTNPDNPIEGQVWYNTTANTARYQYQIDLPLGERLIIQVVQKITEQVLGLKQLD